MVATYLLVAILIIMGNLKSTQALILLLLNLGTLLISLACRDCPYPTPPSKSPNLPLKSPPKVKSPVAKPSIAPKPPPHHISKKTLYFSWAYRHYAHPHEPPWSRPPGIPRYPFVHPPIRHELPIFATLPITPKPPIVYPPLIPTPPITPPVITLPPLPPVVPQPLPETPYPPPLPQETPPPPPQPKICPTLKLDECVNELGSLMHVGINSKAKDTCCPVLAGILDLDAALCLCTTIKAKLLNINPVIPIALQVLGDCGKTLPSGFQCPA